MRNTMPAKVPANPASVIAQLAALGACIRAQLKAQGAYGEAIARDLERAIARLQNRPDWLERCMRVMAMSLPKAVLWSRIRALRRGLA